MEYMLQADNNHNKDFHRGVYRVKGDTIEIFPSHEDETAYRLEFFGDTLDRISEFNAITGKTLNELTELSVYPNTHYVTNTITVDSVIEQMKKDLLERCAEFVSQNKLLEEQRLTQRTMFDIEMIKETGYCTGIENYSRYFDGRAAGSTPYTLISYALFHTCLVLHLHIKHYLLCCQTHQTLKVCYQEQQADENQNQLMSFF